MRPIRQKEQHWSSGKILREKISWILRQAEQQGNVLKDESLSLHFQKVLLSIRLFSDVMKRLGIKLDGDGLYEEFQRIYDESVGRDTDKDKAEDKMWNRGRGR